MIWCLFQCKVDRMASQTPTVSSLSSWFWETVSLRALKSISELDWSQWTSCGCGGDLWSLYLKWGYQLHGSWQSGHLKNKQEEGFLISMLIQGTHSLQGKPKLGLKSFKTPVSKKKKIERDPDNDNNIDATTIETTTAIATTTIATATTTACLTHKLVWNCCNLYLSHRQAYQSEYYLTHTNWISTVTTLV